MIIWFGGPHLFWNGHAPFAHPQRRLYIILSFYLLWLLKVLILDFDSSGSKQEYNTAARQSLQHLLNRFRGAIKFMRSTSISRQGGHSRLTHLPWYLLIGPTGAGKTALLSHSHVNFILQRQFSARQLSNLEPSEHCDWWITRDACLIDVPGRYLHPTGVFSSLWPFLLQLIRKNRNHDGISGVILALPLPELMKQHDASKLQAMLRIVQHRLDELRAAFKQSLPCTLVITKCDLLPGFTEFFSESAEEETSQAWGITLPVLKAGEKIEQVFSVRFNALVKKLNQQLIWRLHQERNPMIRPHIKDFPLQVERLKSFTLEVIKKLTTMTTAFHVHGVYLTSSQQIPPAESSEVIDETQNQTQHAIQLFREPPPQSRAYFVKQFLSYGFALPGDGISTPPRRQAWKRRLTYAASAATITAAVWFLGRDFELGIRQTYSIQNKLANYELAIKAFHNPDESLLKTITLLNTLQKSVQPSESKRTLRSILTFYSNKSDQKAAAVYLQALRNIFLPEIRNYLGESIKNPINQNADAIYSGLKAYLMMGDAAHFNADDVKETLLTVLPKTMNADQMAQFTQHLNLALYHVWQPIALNSNLIQSTRQYLATIHEPQLGYIILKSTGRNSAATDIRLGVNNGSNPVFSSQQIVDQLPMMFTAKAFRSILSSETETAARETVEGNWVLGTPATASGNMTENAATLTEQLRTAYVAHYVEVWESLISNIRFTTPKDLAQTDAILISLIGQNSPLIQLLQTLYENTYFEPVTIASPKLYALDRMVDKSSAAGSQIYPILSGLQSLHQYIQPVITSENPKKAAYELISTRMLHQGAPDPITQLRLIADKSPEPVKNWLNQLTNDTWRFLLQGAMRYLDTSWKEQVVHPYQLEIANRYPFSNNSLEEVDLHQFIKFFGNPGIVTNFYNRFLQALVDTTAADWRWKSIDNQKLPLSDDTLRQIQQAVRIHHAFFPDGGNQLFVQFSLQPYQFGKDIKSVKLNVNNRIIADGKRKTRTPHVLNWPGRLDNRMTSIQLTMTNLQVIRNDYPGTWGWFKLINQSYESPVSQKQVLVNFSQNKIPVKYVLSTDGQFNPMLTLNLYHFRLPTHL